MSQIVVDATLKLRDILSCKYRLVFDKNQWGITWDVSTLSLFSKLFLLPMRLFLSAVVSGIIYPVMMIFGLIRIYMNTKKELHGQKCLTVKYMFSDAGIYSSFKTEKTLVWEEIEKIKEVKKYFYVFSGSELLLIPKRDFRTVDDLTQVKRLFRDKLPQEILKLKTAFYA